MLDGVVFKYLSNLFEFKIKEEFELSLDELINSKESYFRIAVNACELVKWDKFEFKSSSFTIDDKLNTGKITINFDKDSNLLINIESVLFNITQLSDVNSVILIILTMITNSILGEISLKNSYYLTSERSVLVTDNKALTRRIHDKSYFSKKSN